MINLLNEKNQNLVKIEKLSENNVPDSFSCFIPEYTDFVSHKALNFQNNYITNTYLLIERETGKTIAFVSLSCDLVLFTPEEKNVSNLEDISFTSFPALKIAQLAVDDNFKEKYNNIGSFLIYYAQVVAFDINHNAACRFLTVDADIENNPTVTSFYQKNGFELLTDKKYTKKTKIACMWKDILNL